MAPCHRRKVCRANSRKQDFSSARINRHRPSHITEILLDMRNHKNITATRPESAYAAGQSDQNQRCSVLEPQGPHITLATI